MKRMLILLVALALLLGAPVMAESTDLPSCFIPQVTAQYFNGMLQEMFRTLGAPDPASLAEQYRLTRAQSAGRVLYLSNADGTVELNALFYDGDAAVDRPASTLTLAVAGDVDRSQTLAVAATFAVAIAETDSSAGDFEELLNWMSDAVDGTASSIKGMNGYTLTYTKNSKGRMFALIGGGAPSKQKVSPTVAPTATPTPVPTQAPTPKPTQKPTEAPRLAGTLDGAALEWDGVFVKPVRYTIAAYGNDYVSMRLYFRVLNTTDRLIRVGVEDVSVDGVRVYSTRVGNVEAYTDTGDDAPDYALITSEKSNEAAGLQAIASARKVKLTLVLQDEDYHELCSKKVSVKLSGLKGTRDVPDDFRPEPAQTKKPRSSYRSLCKGDKGDDVKRLQQKLIDLGWLNDVADGAFGSKTASAVRAFNEANGLGSSQVASVETQEKLFSASAKGYEEPWIPVETTYLKWKNVTGDGTSYKIEITNHSRTKTIKGVELRYYPADVWGNKLWDYDYRYSTFTLTVKPGKSKYTQWFYMSPSWYSIDRLYVGVSKVAFTDGTIHENSSVTYDYFTLH